MRFHTVVQLICLIISSTTCFLVYGMRNSEQYAERVLYEENIGKLDEFLTSVKPNSIVGPCWVITFFTQLLHSRRMEAEAKFHWRSVDDQKHSKMIHRFTSWVDHNTKKIIEKFQLGDDEARVEIHTYQIPWLLTKLFFFRWWWFLERTLTSITRGDSRGYQTFFLEFWLQSHRWAFLNWRRHW